MHVVIGRQSRRVATTDDISAWAAGYEDITVDLGTGDGRYIRHLAAAHPTFGFIGVDLCHANLRETARRSPANALFVIADALAIPAPLHGMADKVTIEFPWGSLLRGLLDGEDTQVDGIAALGKPGVALDLNICLNAGALAEEGWPLEAGCERVAAVLQDYGVSEVVVRRLGHAELRCLPTTWAKRLAFGRDPRAVLVDARLNAPARRIASNALAPESRRSSCPGQQRAMATRGEVIEQAVRDQEAAFKILRSCGDRFRHRAG